MEHPGSSLQGPVAKRAPELHTSCVHHRPGGPAQEQAPCGVLHQDSSVAQGTSCRARQHLLVLLLGFAEIPAPTL